MLTEVKAYSSWQSAPTLLLSENGRAETDLIQIRNIEGLNPVKASVNTSPLGSIDGTSYTGGSILNRNIVLTIRPNPDWNIWTYEGLRKLLYKYFMPKRPVRLVFESDDLVPVEISGIVEDVAVNPFSQDPELLVSVVCPDPYFTAVDPVILTGQAVRSGGAIVDIDYQGTIETGVQVKVTYVTAPSPASIAIQIGDLTKTHFTVAASVDANKYFELNSLPKQKFVQNVSLDDGVITNLLSYVEDVSSWPTLQPGENHFSVITDTGVQDWELRYSERFGGL